MRKHSTAPESGSSEGGGARHHCRKWLGLGAALLISGLSAFASDTPVRTEVARLAAPPPANDFHQYNFSVGAAVAVEGEWLAVGDPNAWRYGEVYMYHRTAKGWEYRQRLTHPRGGHFGLALALQENTLIVGAPNSRHQGQQIGMVFVYRRTGVEWTLAQEIVRSELIQHIFPQFGSSVDICGNIMAIGARNSDFPVEHAGGVYIYERRGGAWALSSSFFLRASPEVVRGDIQSLGDSIAVSGYRVVAGAPGDIGAVFIYEKGASAWKATTTIRSPGRIDDGVFGRSVDIDEDHLVVGRPMRFSPIIPGGAYIYTLDASDRWVLEQELKASDGFANGDNADYFGTSVSIQGSKCVVGALNGDWNGLNTGTVYLFERQAGAWPKEEDERWVASESQGVSDRLGASVDFDGDWVVSGAIGGWVDGVREGKAYLFGVQPGELSCGHLTGAPSKLSVVGSDSVSSNRLWIVARDVPAQQFGIFLLSSHLARAPFRATTPCLGNPVLALARTAIGSTGNSIFDLDLQGEELRGRLVSGSTFHVQFAYKDPDQARGGFDLTNAVSLTLD